MSRKKRIILAVVAIVAAALCGILAWRVYQVNRLETVHRVIREAWDREQPEDQPASVGEQVTFTVKADNVYCWVWQSSTDGVNWTDVSDPGMNLAPGTYYVRYKETANYKASVPATVRINPGSVLAVTFDANGGTGTMSSLEVTYNVAKILTANAFT